MKVVVMVFSIEAIPIGALASVVFAGTLRRRSRFWLRFAGVAIAVVFPVLATLAASFAAHVGERTAGLLLLSALPWGILLLALSRFVLFGGPGLDPGSSDEDDDGPGPGDGRPTPPAPIGGIPLPDAEPSSTRIRDHRPPRPRLRPRRPVRRHERIPARMWQLRREPGRDPAL